MLKFRVRKGKKRPLSEQELTKRTNPTTTTLDGGYHDSASVSVPYKQHFRRNNS